MAKLITTLRTMLHPYWVPAETGGIFLMGAVNDDEANSAIFSQAHYTISRYMQPAATLSGKRLTDEICKIAHHILQTWHLAPGPYELDNYHRALAQNGELELNQWNSPPSRCRQRTDLRLLSPPSI